MDDHPYYLRQRANTFPVIAVSTLSALIASSNIVRSQLPTVASQRTEPVSYTSTNIPIIYKSAKMPLTKHIFISQFNN